MAEREQPVIITAISHTERESFIAGTLFSQGWNVVFRALDFQSLQEFVFQQPELAKNSLLLFSPDLLGISPDAIDEISGSLRQVIGFNDLTDSSSQYSGLYSHPGDTHELIAMVRGFIRTPLIRPSATKENRSKRAQVIAIASAGSSTGASTIAINLAMELSILEKKTLLIDGNFQSPSIAALLSLRSIDDGNSWRKIAPLLSVGELDQRGAENIYELLPSACEEFDFILIDLGTAGDLSQKMTDRRWQSRAITWSAESADQFWFIARNDLLGRTRLEELVQGLKKTSITPKTSLLLNCKSPSRKGDSEESEFRSATQVLNPDATYFLPKDVRAVESSQNERATLAEISERSSLRKAIAAIAAGIAS